MTLMMIEEPGSVECRQEDKEVMDGECPSWYSGEEGHCDAQLEVHGHLDIALT
jgi:hypothetical protein